MKTTLAKIIAVMLLLVCICHVGGLFDGGNNAVIELTTIEEESTMVHFEYEDEENVDVNGLYDALYAMYGIRIYSAHTNIPLYFQSDYEDVEFSGSTVAEVGCGITCLAMVATYLLDKEVLPNEMAYRYDCGPNPAAAMVNGIRDLGLNCNTYYGDAIHEHVWNAIENGQPVIALMRRESLFTTGGHFIVIAGITGDGRYIINDPSKKNYNKESMKEKYKTGFTKKELCQGLTGVYIFDKKAHSEETETALSVYANVMDIRSGTGK